MKNREILKSVLEKAINNGYEVNQTSFDYLMNLLRTDDKYCQSSVEYYIKERKYFDNIFSHDFAVAFFGKQKHEYKNNKTSLSICGYCSAYRLEYEWAVGKYCWEQHLSDMVLDGNPLEYLGNYL